jgi:hypothetical protein
MANWACRVAIGSGMSGAAVAAAADGAAEGVGGLKAGPPPD